MNILDDKGKTISKTPLKELNESYDNLAIHRARLHEVLLSQLSEDKIITGKRTKDIIFCGRL